MERAGAIGEDERIELLGGRIYRMTIDPPHAWAVAALTRNFVVAFNGRAAVAAQHPLLLREGTYLDHPQPHDVLLLVEVSDRSLRKDTALKLPLYAQAGIPELWIVNLVDRRIEVYTTPEGSDYRYRAFHELTAALAPRAWPDTSCQWLPDTLHALLDHHAAGANGPAAAPQ